MGLQLSSACNGTAIATPLLAAYDARKNWGARASLRVRTMHNKLPVLTVLLLLTLTAATTFICLSGAVTPRYTEYGSGKAFFKHYIIKPAQMQQMPRGLSVLS
jgi:hypothetical protein